MTISNPVWHTSRTCRITCILSIDTVTTIAPDLYRTMTIKLLYELINTSVNVNLSVRKLVPVYVNVEDRSSNVICKPFSSIVAKVT